MPLEPRMCTLICSCVFPSPSQVRDPTSDIAVVSKKGSLLLKEHREKRDRSKMRCGFGRTCFGSGQYRYAPMYCSPLLVVDIWLAGFVVCFRSVFVVSLGYPYLLSENGFGSLVALKWGTPWALRPLWRRTTKRKLNRPCSLGKSRWPVEQERVVVDMAAMTRGTLTIGSPRSEWPFVRMAHSHSGLDGLRGAFAWW
jgi:hypothetical protein